MSYLEELLPEFRKGAKIRRKSWDNKRYVHFKNDECCDESECTYDLNRSLIADDWEFYQEPIDYDYIIKNKCLCSFWDNEGDEIIITTLNDILIGAGNNMQFFDGLDNKWENCYPVRRDEVTFYEDRKDD